MASPTAPDAGAWTLFLDSLESELQAVHRAGDGQLRPVPPFAPPEGIGDLPAHLAGRARGLLAELRASQEAIHAEMQRTARQLEELRRMDPRGARPAGSFDAKI